MRSGAASVPSVFSLCPLCFIFPRAYLTFHFFEAFSPA